MRLGIFVRTFTRPTLGATLEAVRSSGLECIHFNMMAAGAPSSMPEQIEPALADRIRQEEAGRGLSMVSVSGTFNMAHPDPERRRAGLRRLRVLAEACSPMGVSVVSLCTGTRDPDDLWRRHPENDRPDAWRDMTATMGEALAMADRAGVTLAIEPEVANVVDSARKARRLLDEMRSPRLKVIIDPANLFQAGDLPRMRPILDEAFQLLGPDIVLAHAKDLSRDGEAGHEAAGTGLLDYDYYLNLLSRIGFQGPILLHGLSESQVPPCVAFLRAKLAGVAGHLS
jgi:sugar phosphate isomerase/epimerase